MTRDEWLARVNWIINNLSLEEAARFAADKEASIASLLFELNKLKNTDYETIVATLKNRVASLEALINSPEYKNIQQEYAEYKQYCEGQIAAYKNEITQLKNSQTHKVDEYLSQINSLKTQLLNSTNFINLLKNEKEQILKQTQEYTNTLKTKSELVNKLQSELSYVTGQLPALRNQITQIEKANEFKLNELNAQISVYETRLTNTLNNNEQLIKEKERILSENQDYIKKLEAKNLITVKLQSELDVIKNENSKLKNDVQILQNTIKVSKNQIPPVPEVKKQNLVIPLLLTSTLFLG